MSNEKKYELSNIRIETNSITQDAIIADIDNRSFAICYLPKLSPQVERNKTIICEAFNVATETGMTPLQLQSRIKELEDLVIKAFNTFRYRGFPHNDPTLGDWLKENDIELFEKLNTPTP